MGVTASMSISLLIDGELAGLIACHHYSGPFAPSAPVRATCEFLAQTLSLMLGARERDERIAQSLSTGETLAEVVRGTREARDDLGTGLIPHAEALLRMVGASGMSWTLDGRTRTAARCRRRPTWTGCGAGPTAASQRTGPCTPTGSGSSIPRSRTLPRPPVAC